jgi:hypothetical protein
MGCVEVIILLIRIFFQQQSKFQEECWGYSWVVTSGALQQEANTIRLQLRPAFWSESNSIQSE